MKKLIFLIIASLFFTITQGQKKVDPERSGEYYLLKSKTNQLVQNLGSSDFVANNFQSRKRQKLALGLFAGGIVSTTVGIIMFKENFSFGGGNPQETIGIALTLIGIGSVVASIPVFISANQYNINGYEMTYNYRPLQLDPVFANHTREHVLVFRIALE